MDALPPSPPPSRPRLSETFLADRAAATASRPPPRVTMGQLGVMLTLVFAGIVAAVAVALWWPAAPSAPPRDAVRRAPASSTATPHDGGRTDAATIAPVELLPVSREEARAINAAVPFSTAPNPAAAPLRLTLDPVDRQRATDCLAAAVWYEAGDDTIGEQAVAQVVLNRLRHPIFPRTVCGVVFQGSERDTGCQFSFTCDGALARQPAAEAWDRARGIAAAALNGLVFPAVGYATHYHTDWVVPNWSSSVDKIAAVHTHLFFRWRGGAGRPPAFTGRHAGAEPVIAALARVSPIHAGVVAEATPTISLPAAALSDADLAVTPPPLVLPPAASLRGNALSRRDPRTGLFVIRIDPGIAAGALALSALDLCRPRGREACTVVGFAGAPGAVISDGTHTRWPEKTPDFFYFADRSRGREQVYWNCARFPRPPAQCLPPNFQPEG